MNGVLICNCFKYFILFDSLINELCFVCREKKGVILNVIFLSIFVFFRFIYEKL